MAAAPPVSTAEARLRRLLDRPGVRHRLIEHPPEGRTGPASLLRGHDLRQSAKSLVIRVKRREGADRLAVVVVPGDRRVDTEAVRLALGGHRAAFADRVSAERATGCVSGTVVPFSFDPELPLLVDPDLLAHDEIFFNAARLDLSVALNTADYLAMAEPRVVPVAEPADPAPGIETTETVMNR